MERLIPQRQTGDGASARSMFRDNFTLSTWMALGAVCQTALYSLFGRLAFLPAIVLLLYRLADAYATVTGLKHNKYMDGIIPEMVSAQIPGGTEGADERPSNSDICVFILGSKVNHPMGLLAPGYKELGQCFMSMVSDLQENAEKLGYLGSKALLGAESPTNNESITIMYFKSSEHAQAYAQGPLHHKTSLWWSKTVAKYPHIGIFHELYHVPKNNWETLYSQMAPTLAGNTSHKVPIKSPHAGVEFTWKNPLVEARGVLRSSLGRMGRSPGTFIRRDLTG